jgi:hypothetical protein
MRSLQRLAALLGGLSLSFAALAADIDSATYGFPVTNPFEATITSTPLPQQPKVPTDDEINQSDYDLDLMPGRAERLPDAFWAVKTLKYRLARQDGAAPLIFIIAGTGAKYDDSKPEFLKKLFYGAGYHVVQISSPTSFDFIVAASTSATPGMSKPDAEDLYRVMEAISEQHKDLPVTSYNVTGYSLGGLNAAFVSKLDEERQRFNFERVLLLNPPVNLYTSVSNLDSLVDVAIPGVNNKYTFLDELTSKLTKYFNEKGRISIDDATMFHFQNSKERLSNEQMAMLIGASFRSSSADIIFTSDFINKRGLITPVSTVEKLDNEESFKTALVPLYRKSLDCNFVCYMNQQVLPFWKKSNPQGDLQQLVHETGLVDIQDYLKTSPKIAVFHNADDIILGPGDLGFLRETFGERLTVYPLGGHCGNINYRVNTDAMLEFFRG